jgi:hypothetical protein
MPLKEATSFGVPIGVPSALLPLSPAIAWLLGFREVSAFTHAYKRWTGKTPSQMRTVGACHGREPYSSSAIATWGWLELPGCANALMPAD